MDKMDIFNNFCKMLIINIYIYFIFIRITNYKDNKFKKLPIIIIFSTIMAIVDVICMQHINPLFIIPFTYCMYSVFLKLMLKERFNYCFLLTNISFVITYLTYLTSVFLTEIVLYLAINGISYKHPINIIVITSIMILIYLCLSKLKRIKNGINFLSNRDNVNKKGKVINILYFITFIIFGLLDKSDNIFMNYLIEWMILIIITGIIYWLQSQITKYYKKNMRDRTIEVQKTEIDEQKKIIEEIKQENIKLADVVHKYNNRLSAVENALEDAISKNMNTEFANELSVILSETKEIAKNFAKESEVTKLKLPLTNIPGIDNMFKYMQKEAINNNIKFDLKLTDSIHDLIDNIIPKDKFETMLGDHLRDAIIAVNNSKNSYKSILVTLGIVENCYELSIYDTGIEFEINTLLKLGKERITTHKETGGSGIGFMTTFDTLRKAKGSLIIEEYDSKNSSYTKSVNIIFDGKNEYRIYSYRAEEIKKQNKDKRIIIKDI